ncbi:phage baseplate protein [Opitutaceae bacterium TAV4]|nr:phage baseplate protein [Opitutaceae bacterium TAV4]RRK00793.1 phage baseplate protein [Opitutaceae bacterium TAV3]
MRGTDKSTGKPADGIAHLRQSIQDILTTPLGSRVMRRDYGSRLFDLLDAPVTPSLLAPVTAAVGEALARWEPRFSLESVGINSSATTPAAGRLVLTLKGRHVPDGQPLTLEGIVIV